MTIGYQLIEIHFGNNEKIGRFLKRHPGDIQNGILVYIFLLVKVKVIERYEMINEVRI